MYLYCNSSDAEYLLWDDDDDIRVGEDNPKKYQRQKLFKTSHCLKMWKPVKCVTKKRPGNIEVANEDK